MSEKRETARNPRKKSRTKTQHGFTLQPKKPTLSRFCSLLLRKSKNGVEPSPLQEAVGGGGRTIRRRGPGDVFTSTGKPPRPAPNPSRPLPVPLPAGPGAPPLATLARAGPHVSAAHAPNRRETSSLVHPKPPDPKCTNASSPPCHSPKVLCSPSFGRIRPRLGGMSTSTWTRSAHRSARSGARSRTVGTAASATPSSLPPRSRSPSWLRMPGEGLSPPLHPLGLLLLGLSRPGGAG